VLANRISRRFAVFVLGAVVVSAQTPTTVSVDLLRHPVSRKVRKMLRSAFEKMQSGEHEAAIAQLTETLAKFPDSAVSVHSLLGVEYLRTDRVRAAVDSFEQAASLLPHDAFTHYNLGLTLLCAGNSGRARQEIGRAMELDPANPRIQEAFNAMRSPSRTEHGEADLRHPSGNKP
jgi:Flp pilus assembly protein TadD